jgi:hypothetical protein
MTASTRRRDTQAERAIAIIGVAAAFCFFLIPGPLAWAGHGSPPEVPDAGVYISVPASKAFVSLFEPFPPEGAETCPLDDRLRFHALSFVVHSPSLLQERFSFRSSSAPVAPRPVNALTD